MGGEKGGGKKVRPNSSMVGQQLRGVYMRAPRTLQRTIMEVKCLYGRFPDAARRLQEGRRW